MKKQTFSRFMACGFMVITFFLLPINRVYADTYSDDSTFWRWWYVEQITDEMTNGNGVNVDNIDETYNGSTVGEYVYNSTGITADDVKEYVKNQYDNAVGYVDKSAEQYSNMIDDIWNSSVDVATKATYKAQKALRETVDTAGNTVVNVSSSSYWGNVYNDLFNNGSYNDQYAESQNGSYDVEVNNANINISVAGKNGGGDLTPVDNGIQGIYTGYNILPLSSEGQVLFRVGDGYYNTGYSFGMSFSTVTINSITWNGSNGYNVSWSAIHTSGVIQNRGNTIYLVNGATGGTVTEGGSPVLQPKQVGYVMHNGVKFPVFSDPSLNPFKINDDGTVTWNDGTGTEPIFVDPSQLTDDGWLNILENVDNNDSTENPYNPFGLPWNTQDDGTSLGGFFGNLVKDIGSVFKGLADTLSKLLSGLINGILDALKSLFDINFNQLNMVQFSVDFDIIQDVINKLLEMLGVHLCLQI